MKKAPLHTRGFSLVEILVALAVFMFFVVAIGGVTTDTARNARHVANSERATILAEEAIEASRNLRDASPDFAALPDGTYGLATTSNQWNLSGSSDITGIFTRSITVSTVNSSQKKVVATVLWPDQISSSNSVTAHTYLTNWRAPLSIGLTVAKSVINHGGTKVAGDFLPINLTTLAWDNSADPPVQSSVDIPIVFSPSTMTLAPGTYTFSTSNYPDYSLALSPDCGGGNIVLANGDAKLCNIIYEQYYVPTLATPTATSIASTTATLGATVTSLGNPTSISARGTCWDTTPSPTANCLAEGATTTGAFTQARTGFTAGTTYYYRGYATNSFGTGYSTDGTFVTSSPTPMITFVGQATAGGTTASIPAHNVGDLLVAFAYRDGAAAPPAVPAGWTTIDSSGNANANSSVLAYRIATGVEPAAGWSDANEIIVHAYRGVSANPIGANGAQSSAGTIVTYPAVTLTVTNGTSWIVGFAGHRSTNTNLQNAPSGMTVRSNRSDATAEVAGHDTALGVSSWSATNVSVGGTSSGWMTRVLEIKSQ